MFNTKYLRRIDIFLVTSPPSPISMNGDGECTSAVGRCEIFGEGECTSAYGR